jgi:hypothetical protein
MRRTLTIDDKLDDLVVERDSIRIQISLLGDRNSVDADELAALRGKARDLEALINARQRML